MRTMPIYLKPKIENLDDFLNKCNRRKYPAKSTIIYAVGGLLVILLSYAVVENVIRYLYDEAQDYNDYEQVEPLETVE